MNSWPQYLLVSIGAIAFIGAILANLLITDHILKTKIIDHSKNHWQLILKALTCSPAIFFLSMASEFQWWFAIGFSTWMVASWFWLGFDGILGLIRKRGFWDTGSEDGSIDAGTDNFLQSLPKILGAIIKLSLVFGSTYVYIIGLSK